MNLKILFFFIFIRRLEGLINDGIYNIIYKNLFLKYNNLSLILSKSFLSESNSNFRIIKKLNEKNESFYYIENLNTKYKLGFKNKKENIIENQEENNLWTFIHLKNNNYIIKNKNKCYIIVKELKLNCVNSNLEQASEFRLEKIYEEVKTNKTENEIIEKEPIDVLIKYIDLRDPNLKRKGLHQIKKDFDNEELRYSIRSILKNIPWVRKIFILMPNEKVRYFKNYNLIKKKIVYVKDKDLLGYDSSNSHAFQYRYWKMKKFGISDNFIIMDDDYFIGSALKKTDFFYVENKKIVPAIITKKFCFIKKNYAIKRKNFYKNKIKNSKREQTKDIFLYTQFLAYLYLIKIFKRNIIVPKFTHNAIPVNINEIKEIFYLIKNSEYKSATLDSLYRHKESIQFQAFLLSYTFIKYNKKVRHIPYKYINNKNSFLNNYNYSLFCINTGAYKYSDIDFLKTRIVMDFLFPIPTIYEIYSYSISSISFKVIQYLLNIINIKTNQFKEDKNNNYTTNYYTIKNNKIYYFLFYIGIILIIIILFIKLIYKYFSYYYNRTEII